MNPQRCLYFFIKGSAVGEGRDRERENKDVIVYDSSIVKYRTLYDTIRDSINHPADFLR